MEEKIKDHGLWSFSHKYVFSDQRTYFYEGTITSKDVATFLGLPITQGVVDSITKNCDHYQSVLEHDFAFNDWATNRYYEDASFLFYHDVLED